MCVVKANMLGAEKLIPSPVKFFFKKKISLKLLHCIMPVIENSIYSLPTATVPTLLEYMTFKYVDSN